jgi:hypothetical protein
MEVGLEGGSPIGTICLTQVDHLVGKVRSPCEFSWGCFYPIPAHLVTHNLNNGDEEVQQRRDDQVLLLRLPESL